MTLGGDFWASVPLGRAVRLITCDSNGLAALDKPEGILSHPNGPGDQERSLVRARYDRDEECFGWGESGRLWLVNRLDSATSGVILAATNADLARAARARFRGRGVRKAYVALVFGKPRQASELWRDRLDVRKLGGRIRTAAGPEGIETESRMILLHSAQGAMRVSLIRLEPRTGRSHQLRVQCARRRLPIVGDRTYGDFAANRDFARGGGSKRMFLHSLEVALDYDFAGRTHPFSASAPLPAEFESFRK